MLGMGRDERGRSLNRLPFSQSFDFIGFRSGQAPGRRGRELALSGVEVMRVDWDADPFLTPRPPGTRAPRLPGLPSSVHSFVLSLCVRRVEICIPAALPIFHPSNLPRDNRLSPYRSLHLRNANSRTSPHLPGCLTPCLDLLNLPVERLHQKCNNSPNRRTIAFLI
jgi:hypothetical protein